MSNEVEKLNHIFIILVKIQNWGLFEQYSTYMKENTFYTNRNLLKICSPH